MKARQIQTLGVASCIGGPSASCAEAPKVIQQSSFKSLLQDENYPLELNWQDVLEVTSLTLPASQKASHKDIDRALKLLKKQSGFISQFSQQQVEQGQPFLVIGGDHSIAIGTWAGVLNQIPPEANFALLWIDAHMDAHTLQTSQSGNIHGMPVSLMLGEADYRLMDCYPGERFIYGRDLYMFGIRSYEAEEVVLLSKTHTNVFDTERVEAEGGTYPVLSQLLNTIARCYDYFAISLDLDAIDPQDAPGVETRASTGLSAEYLLAALSEIQLDGKFVGLEIAEFDPGQDIEQKTEKLVYEIIRAVFC